jgi:hypothetical protein
MQPSHPSFLLPTRSGKLITWAEFNRIQANKPRSPWARLLAWLRRF